MASVKISELNTLNVITGDDFIPIVDSGSGTTYRAPIVTLNTWLSTNGLTLSSSHASSSLTSLNSISASYSNTASSAVNAFSASHALTASYFDTTGLSVINATNAINAQTASCLQGIGTSHEQDLQISRSIRLSGSSTIYIPRKRDVQNEGTTHNCIYFHSEYGNDVGSNDWSRIYYAEDVLDAGRLVSEIGDNIDALLPIGPNIDFHGINSSGFLWQTYTSNVYATGSLMFLKTDGKLYVRSVEAKSFSASFEPTKVGFYGTASQAMTASHLLGGITGGTLPIGSIIDFAGASDPADSNWIVCDGRAIDRTTYASLFSIIGTTWGEGDGASTFNIPNFKGRLALGADGTFNTIKKVVGEYGGGEAANQHYHMIGRHDRWSNGVAKGDDLRLPFLDIGIGGLDSSRFPTNQLYILRGSRGTSEGVQPDPDTSIPNVAGDHWVVGTSYQISSNNSDLMPPYGVTQKIIRVS